MVNTLVASLALYGALASATSVGSAHVVNSCSYDVWLSDVPASGGGYEETDQVLSPGGTWEQAWTQLSNGDGWSIKLSKSSSLESILQYEYTWQNEGTIWYDLSCVNGNPWDGNWEITSSTDDCNPKQQAYMYATDDAYGEQSCPQDASITVTLCSGDGEGNSTSSSSGSSSSASAIVYASTTAVASSEESTTTPATSYEATTASTTANWWHNEDDLAYSAPTTATTFATQTTAVSQEYGVTVTEVETAIVTAIVTAYNKRHEHHPHGHRRHA